MHRPNERRKSLHAANVELIALDNAEIKYSTVQNWYPEIKMVKVASITLSLSVDYAKVKTQKFLGLKLKQVVQLHGNIQVVYYKVIILWVNFTQLQ